MTTASPNGTRSGSGKEESIPKLASELRDLVVAYAKQETVGPLVGLGKFVAYGLGGAIVTGIGVAILALALLRGLQTRTGGVFHGNESWLPYIIVLVGGALVAVLATGAILSGRPRRRSKRSAA